MDGLPNRLRCRICGTLFWQNLPSNGAPRHDQYPSGCPTPVEEWDETYERESYPCFTCGKCDPSVTFSGSQRRKGPYGRCSGCVSRGSRSRFERAANCKSWKSKYDLLGEDLIDAVVNYDLDRVVDYLERGADPNYHRQNEVYDQLKMKRWPTWFADGRPTPELDTEMMMQPTTPLKMVVFQLSFCYFLDISVEVFRGITIALLKAGADAEPAGRYIRHRYLRRNERTSNGHIDYDLEQVLCFIEDAADGQL